MGPEMIGEYEVAEKLGEGGMGAVYRAVDRMLERDVALKLLRPDVSGEPDLVERFRTEAVILAKLNHPNIATLYRLAREGDSLVMVMEFVRGQTLSRLLGRSRRLPTAHAVSWCCQVLDAMDYAHDQRVVHRDLKPANIMVTDGGVVKVTDFGIARALGTGRQTRFGFVIGTPAYMSPEQVRGQEVDGRSDIYSLGAVLFELITGRLPFVAADEFSILAAHVGQEPPAPQSVRPDVPGWLDQAILCALSKSPGARYQTAAELRSVLESGLSELVSGDDDTHPLDLPPPRQRATTSPRIARMGIGLAPGTRVTPDAPLPAAAAGDVDSTTADRPVRWWQRWWKRGS